MIRKFLPILFASVLLMSCSDRSPKEDKMVDLENVTDHTELRIAELTGALQKETNNPVLYSKRARLYLEQKKHKLALQDIEKAISLNDRNGEFLFIKAQILRDANQISQALKAALAAEELNYIKPELYVLTGELFFIIKQYQKAIEYQNKALKLASFNEFAYYYKGLVYAETGDTTRAITSFQTSIEQEPTFIDPYNELARIYNARKDYASSAQYLQSGLRFAPYNGFLWFNQGDMLRAQQYPDSAVASFKNAVHYDTSLYMANYNIGVIRYNQDKYQEAIPYFRQVTRHSNVLPMVRLLLADSYERTGDKAKALEEYRRALEEQPGNQLATQRADRLQRQLRAQPKDTTATR